MNEVIDNDIVITKEFHQRVASLYKLGGRNRNIFNKVQGLLGGIREEGAKAFTRFSITNHGEGRIKSCVKYDFGMGFRLVTVKRDKIIWVLFVGSHDDADSWLNKNSGWTPVRAADGEIRTVRNGEFADGHELRGDIVPGQTKLIDRFEDGNYYSRFLGLLPPLSAVQIAAMDGDTEVSMIKHCTGQIVDPDLAACAACVLIALLEDDKIQAQDLIDLYEGSAADEQDWSEDDYVKIARGDAFYNVIIGSQEYEKALNHIAQKGSSLDWLLFMHPEQTRIVEKEFNGPAQLSGVSGSGKTCVALRRAIRLAEESSEAKVLFVTLNKSLVGLIKQLLSLCAPNEKVESRIDVLSMFDLSQRLIVGVGNGDIRFFGELSDQLNEDIDKVFREFYRCWLNNNDGKVLQRIHKILISHSIDAESYIREEFDWIRSALFPNERESYFDIARIGRKFPLQKDIRTEILEGLRLWEKKMKDVGITDYLGLTTAVHEFTHDLGPVYDHVLVDESQDFGTTELSIIQKITKLGPNSLFLCGDVAQSVLPKHRSLSKANIELIGGRERIMKNYRNTRQILDVAYKILLNNLSEDQFSVADGGLEILDPQYANRSLNEPLLLKASSLQEELTYAKKMMEELCIHNANHNGCIVIAGYKISEIKEYSKVIQIPVLDGNLDPLNEPLVISDLEQAKGYEFDTVVILNCTKGILPADGIHEDEVYRSACQLYVSMTRAKNDLYLSFHGTPSPWLENIESLTRANWSDVESILGTNLVLMPVQLDEVYDPDDKFDALIGMTGEEFIYTKYAFGLTVDHQNKITELVDGKGLISSSKRENVKWRDMRSLSINLEGNPNARSLLGTTLTDRILNI